MKLVTAFSTVALALAPAVGLAQAPANGAGDTNDEPSLKSKLEQAIGKITGSSSDTKVGADAKSGDQNSAATSAGDTNYPDRGAVKKTDK
jgi:hypothetical protein